jgi:hypothetical protein
LTIPSPFTWTNRDQVGRIDRTQPLNITWSGAAQSLAIVGAASDLLTNSSAVVLCVAPAGATSFSVPAAVLSTLPASRSDPNQSKAVFFLTDLPISNATRFSVSGLDAAVLMPIYMSGKKVALR